MTSSKQCVLNMADSGGGDEGEKEKMLGSESSEQKTQDMNDNTKVEDNRASKGASRFKVARVDFKETPEEAVPESRSDHPSTPTVAFQVGDETITPGTPQPDNHDTHVGSYDTHNQRTFAHNTLETLPHVDHYRNLLSATGVMRQRPTLLELHELEQVSNFTDSVFCQFLAKCYIGSLVINDHSTVWCIAEALCFKAMYRPPFHSSGSSLDLVP